MDKNGGFTIEKLAGDASTRKYYRLTFNDKQAIPSKLIVMAREPFDEKSDDFLIIRDFLDSCRVPVPALFFTNPQKGLLYLEDCGDELIETIVSKNGAKAIKEFYPKILDYLITMQVVCTKKLKKDNPALGRSFDMEKLIFELNFFKEWFLERFNKKKLSGNDEKRLDNFFEKLVKPITREPKVFTHRDFHARNIMLKNGDVYIIDFQDARMGPLQYDLVSLLFDSYVTLLDSDRDALIEYYLARLKFPKEERESFMVMFYRVALQRNLKALGTFAYQSVCLNKETYKRYIPNTVDYIRSNIYKVDEFGEDTEWLLSLLD